MGPTFSLYAATDKSKISSDPYLIKFDISLWVLNFSRTLPLRNIIQQEISSR